MSEEKKKISEPETRTHHARVFIGYETQGVHQDMPLEELCSLMRSNGFHVHATEKETARCDKRCDED